MWIMITKKLPTLHSPPKLSIFWSTPWPSDNYSDSQVKFYLDQLVDKDADFDLDENGKKLTKIQIVDKAKALMALEPYLIGIGGFEHNYLSARAIYYKDDTIRVFTDEFIVLTQENMGLYIGMTGEDGSHELVSSTVAETTVQRSIFEGALKEVYDTARLDGCTDEQAYAMALGIDVSEKIQGGKLASYPAVGWYRPKKEYAEVFCHPHEIVET